MLKKAFHYLLSFALIGLCLFLGQSLQSLMGVAIPGSIIGMLILFTLLASNIVKVEWIRPGSSLFIRYMILLFVPISVGLMNHFDMLLANAVPIVASTIGGSLIVLVILGLWLEHKLKDEK